MSRRERSRHSKVASETEAGPRDGSRGFPRKTGSRLFLILINLWVTLKECIIISVMEWGWISLDVLEPPTNWGPYLDVKKCGSLLRRAEQPFYVINPEGTNQNRKPFWGHILSVLFYGKEMLRHTYKRFLYKKFTATTTCVNQPKRGPSAEPFVFDRRYNLNIE